MGWSGRSLGYVLAVVAVAGCGRIGFDVPGEGDDDDGTGGGCPSFAIFCEDFESGALAQWTDVETTSGPQTVMVTTSRPHNGMYSLDANKLNTGGSGVADIVGPIGTHNSGTLAVREWIYSESTIELFDLFGGLCDAANDNYSFVGGDTDGHWAVSEYRDGAPETVDLKSTVPTVKAKWTCVELIFTYSSPSKVQVKIDGTTLLNANATNPNATYDHIRVGAVRGQPAGFHLFVDDIVVATQPIGCN